MIDTVRLNIKAGNGGNGCVSFLREKYKPRGGPNGGDGGHGGSVYLHGDASLTTLLHLKFHSTIRAQRGDHGRGKDQRGANGADTVIDVPLGTLVWQLHRGGAKELLADITDPSPHLVARGGRGGWGNAHYVSPTNQEPLLAERGERGGTATLFSELKLLADVGLLALPNSGKSTLISHCSAARPRIAEYPFTTVEPVLGVVSSRGKSFVMMEVPGLIKGAHQGVGLGDEFLRHAERTRLSLHILNGLSEDPIGDFHTVNEELRLFNPALADKPQIVAVNKVDVTEVRQHRETLGEELRWAVGAGPETMGKEAETPIFFISAVTGEGVADLLGKVTELLDTLPEESLVTPQLTAQTPRRAGVPNKVSVEDGAYVVESEELERLAARADMRDYRVLLQLWRVMTRRGVAQQLEESGIQAGDTIRIGQVEVEWF